MVILFIETKLFAGLAKLESGRPFELALLTSFALDVQLVWSGAFLYFCLLLLHWTILVR